MHTMQKKYAMNCIAAKCKMTIEKLLTNEFVQSELYNNLCKNIKHTKNSCFAHLC